MTERTKPSANDVADCIARFNAGRDPERLAMKLAKMRASAFVFLRGTCHLFYQRLPRHDVFLKAPLAWLCGDLHLENFGSYKGDNGLAYFDINDFDEALLAPCTWDLVRFLASVRLGVGDLSVNAAEADALCRTFIEAYGVALAAGKARWVERDTAQGLVRELLDGLSERSRPKYLDTRTVLKGKHRSIRTDGKKALPVDARQRALVVAFIDAFARSAPAPEFFKVLDVARRIAGTGSLGVERYIILVEGKGSPDGNYLLDLKQAVPSSLAAAVPTRQPAWASEAERVVALQERLQAISMAFLHAVAVDGHSFVLRALQPSEDRVALDQWNGKLRRLEEVMTVMGQVTAWAHLRGSGRQGSAAADELIAFGADAGWQRGLMAAAEDCAAAVISDWQSYSAAYDQGFFRTQP